MIQKIKVQASHNYSDRFSEIAQKIKEAGMTIQDEIPLLGHFQGLADEETVERLKMIAGVASVSVIDDADALDRNDYSIA